MAVAAAEVEHRHLADEAVVSQNGKEITNGTAVFVAPEPQTDHTTEDDSARKAREAAEAKAAEENPLTLDNLRKRFKAAKTAEGAQVTPLKTESEILGKGTQIQSTTVVSADATGIAAHEETFNLKEQHYKVGEYVPERMLFTRATENGGSIGLMVTVNRNVTEAGTLMGYDATEIGADGKEIKVVKGRAKMKDTTTYTLIEGTKKGDKVVQESTTFNPKSRAGQALMSLAMEALPPVQSRTAAPVAKAA